MIVDAHCHAGPGDGFTGPWDTCAPLDPYRARADRAGIHHTMIWAAFHSDYALANEAVAAIVRREPARYSALAFVHPARDKGRIGQLVERAVRVHGFKGIKCHRGDARITREVCDVAAHFKLPVLYDVMGEIETVALFAPAYGSVDFIIPHLGSYADEWRHQRALIDILARYPNVYSDTAGVRNFDCLVEAVQRAGVRKLMFGSDGPWIHPGAELAKVRELATELKLDAADSARLTGHNAVNMFRLNGAVRRLVRPPSAGAARAA